MGYTKYIHCIDRKHAQYTDNYWVDYIRFILKNINSNKFIWLLFLNFIIIFYFSFFLAWVFPLELGGVSELGQEKKNPLR